MRRSGSLFRDRRDAGEKLVPLLAALGLKAPIVYALLRGGAAVAAPIAEALHGVPGQPELALGALAEGAAEPTLNPDVIAACDVSEADIAAALAQAEQELRRREATYLAGLQRPDPRGRAAILVDDGLATGATARAALRALRARGAAPLTLAVPVAPADAIAAMAVECDRLICAETHPLRFGIGGCYDDFHQLDDTEVLALLRAAAGKESP
jgi:predicted phosphoribosyltransferase